MDYIAHLSKDRRLKKIIERQEPFTLQKRKNIHLHLCRSIMGQQLSTKVAAVIHKRFLALFNTAAPGPEQILAIPLESLRAIGLSNAKTNYVHNVARFAIEQGIDFKHLNNLSNDEVINYLTQIKGVGRWTTEMLLMFTLGREDVFAVDDLGIQNAMIRLYKLDRTNRREFKDKLLAISEKWSPYRTYACIHLWRWKDKPPAD
jgi:DNA-3-methyladenine glycosylase II